MASSGRKTAITLYPFQKSWIGARPRFKVGMFARQTGKTFTTTLEIVDEILAAESAGRRMRWVILSRGERQAKEAMEEGVKRHCQAYGAAIKAYEFDFQGEIKYKALEASFPGGSRITALPANPDTARGFSANVFLDEFAFHLDSRKIWQALFPVVSAGHRIIVVSTPNGKNNKFYELMTAGDLEGVWHRQVTDIYQAVADGLPRDIEALRRGLNDEDAWAQEYELKWLDEASAWLDYDLINGVEDDEAGNPDNYGGGPCFIGNDIASRNDLWVAWVLEKVGDVFWTREIQTARRISFAEQDQRMDELFHRYRTIRLCMDQTGMGEKPVEDAKRRYGASRVEGVLFTPTSKQILAVTGKQAFEDRKIRIPRGDTALRADLHKLRKVVTALGAPRFEADSDSSGHADRAWACFLAIFAGASPTAPIEYRSTGVKREAAKMGNFLGARW